MKRLPSGHLQDDGVLVDIVRKRGGWVEGRDGQAWVQVDRVSWWGIQVTSGNLVIGKSCGYRSSYNGLWKRGKPK